MFKSLMGGVAVIAVIGGLTFGGAWVSYEMYATFNPKYEAVRNKTFHESQSYNDGMIRDLYDLKNQYDNADDGHKVLLRSSIIHRFSIYDKDRLPPDLWAFYQQLSTSSNN